MVYTNRRTQISVILYSCVQVSKDFQKNFLGDSCGFWNEGHEQKVINLTRQFLNSHNRTGFLF